MTLTRWTQQRNPAYPKNQGPLRWQPMCKSLLDLQTLPLSDRLRRPIHWRTVDWPCNRHRRPYILAFHFGKGNDYWPHTGSFDVFDSCTSECDNFTLPSTNAVGSYRLYNPQVLKTQGRSVSEPATFALVGIGVGGLVGLRTLRRREKERIEMRCS